QLTGAHPRLARAGNTIAARGRNAGQKFTVQFVSQLLHRLLGAHGHHVVLPANQINAKLLSFHQLHPGTDTLIALSSVHFPLRFTSCTLEGSIVRRPSVRSRDTELTEGP